MDDKTRKELEEAHQKAMEAIKAFNKVSKETIDEANKFVGLK